MEHVIVFRERECHVRYEGGEMPREEALAYVRRAVERFGCVPCGISAKLEGEEAELSYDFGHRPFQRIRRITGYLVGDLSRFNDAKRAEERDRVKHGADDAR